MKPIIFMLLFATLTSGAVFTTQAQSKKDSKKYEVKTKLTEKEGTYEQRKLYRQFLTEFMNNCPYISHFSIHEAIGDSDNHAVVWRYDVNGWEDITQFYNWVSKHLEHAKENGLKKALTPYLPDYAIGGQIQMEKKSKASYAKK